jgi:hypothetical protein
MPFSGVRAGLALLAACAAILLSLPSAPAAAAVPGIVPDLTWGLSPAEQDREGAAIKELGARWVRLHVQWRDAEPTKGNYSAARFAEYDHAVEVARAAGAKVLFMVYEAPAWASGSSSSNVPRDPADYAGFMRYMAQRYRGQAAAYEIWNEPGHSRFWSTGRNPAAYTRVLSAAYPAIKGADPAATVLVGGLSSYDYSFLDEIYANGGRGSFDAVALHPYTDCGISPLTTWYDNAGRLFGYAFTGYREVRRRMLALGDDKPLWFTEMGWTTTSETCKGGAWTSGVGESTQADYLTKAWNTMAADPYVQVAFWYNLRNEAGERDHVEGRWGLLHDDFSPKPSAAAFQRAVAEYGGAPAPAPSPAPSPSPSPSPSPAPAPLLVSVTAPADGASVAGLRTIDIAAAAKSGAGIASVELRVDGARVATDSSAPYGTRWRIPRRWAAGAHTISATAVDRTGLKATSTVTVHNSVMAKTTLKLATGVRTAVARGRVTGRTSGRVVVRLLGKRGRVRSRAVRVRNGRYRARISVRRGAWTARAVHYAGGERLSSSRPIRFRLRATA